MEAKEAVLEFVVGGELILHEVVHPRWFVLFFAVTVGEIVHDLAGMDALLVVDLPEDDTTFLGTAEVIAVSGRYQLALSQVACGNYRFTELRIQGERPRNEVRR